MIECEFVNTRREREGERETHTHTSHGTPRRASSRRRWRSRRGESERAGQVKRASKREGARTIKREGARAIKREGEDWHAIRALLLALLLALPLQKKRWTGGTGRP